MDFFILCILPVILLSLGLIGNLFSVLFLFKGNSNAINLPNALFKFLFLIDTIYLMLFFNLILTHYEINLNILSSVSCKVIMYLNGCFTLLSPLVVVYLSTYKLFCIKKSTNKTRYLASTQNQLIFLVLLLVFNLVFYVPVILEVDLIINLDSPNTTKCDFINPNSKQTILFIDLVCRTVLPITSMFACTLALIYLIFKSRYDINKYMCADFQVDIKLTFCLIAINIIFMFHNLPISIIGFYTSINTNQLNSEAILSLYLYYFNFVFKFYFLILTNKQFRNEFFKLFK